MEILINYLIKVNVVITLLILLYYFLLKNERFFWLNRVFNIGSILLALILPVFLLKGHNRLAGTPNNNASFLDRMTAYIITPADGKGAGYFWDGSFDLFTRHAAQLKLVKLGCWLYLLIVALLVVRFVFQLVKLAVFLRKTKGQRINGIYYVEHAQEMAPFSFMNYLVINRSGYNTEQLEQIIAHERVHIMQWHSVDILLIELLHIFLWFNPFIYLLKEQVKLNLEYLADECVLQAGADRKKYQLNILYNTISSNPHAIVNLFQSSKLKLRIKMMNTKKRSRYNLLKYATVLPVVFTTYAVFSRSNTQTADLNLKPAALTTSQSLPAAGLDTEPTFPGGTEMLMKFLKENIRYPKNENGAVKQEGGKRENVFVSFNVGEEGVISDIKVLKSAGNVKFDNEVIRVVKLMPKWIPAYKDGHAVLAKVVLPVAFENK